MINKAACFIRMSHMCMQTVEGCMVCDKESLHPFKKERGIRPLTANWEIKNPLRHVIKGNIPRVQN